MQESYHERRLRYSLADQHRKTGCNTPIPTTADGDPLWVVR